ncbi:putative EPIDERMAL PATTERNING FACTOR-like protein [Dioscorea sansibarensis]
MPAKSLLMFLLLLPYLNSVHTIGMDMPRERTFMQQRRKDLGSRPPKCVNKCLSCRPCMATLVVSPRHETNLLKPSTRAEDDTYYLLSWKCTCGDRFFQP